MISAAAVAVDTSVAAPVAAVRNKPWMDSIDRMIAAAFVVEHQSREIVPVSLEEVHNYHIEYYSVAAVEA